MNASSRPKCPIPDIPSGWLNEIVAAYGDAREAIPFGALTGQNITEGELYHVAPVVCLKVREIPRSEARLKQATDAALASYVATTGLGDGSLEDPRMAFAFCYVASHLGLDLIDEQGAAALLDYLAEHEALLVRRCLEQ